METALRVGRWIADGRHCNAQEERRRTLFALLLLHFSCVGTFWLFMEAIFGLDGGGPDPSDAGGDDAEPGLTLAEADYREGHVVHPQAVHHHTLQLANYHLANVLRVLRVRHSTMLVLNALVAGSLLVMLAKQAPLARVMSIWVAYIYAHAFYFAVYRPHLGTEKWFLVVPLQVFFGMGSTKGTLALCSSFVLQVLLFYARQLMPAPPLVLDAPANFVVNLAFITYVGLICGGYEYVRAYALDRMERALDETRRANKSLKHAIEVKERFLANVSHELRTPMHGILSTVEDMVHTTKVRRSHKLREAVTLISDCSDHLCTVINDILDFQTLGTEQIRLERLTFDIVEQIEQVCQMVTASSRNNKQLHFEKSVNIAHSLRVGDPRRTRQIIYNLLSNAFKFTGKDGTVRLDAHEDSAATDFVVIRITDTGTASLVFLTCTQQGSADDSLCLWSLGIGMTEECMKQIFHGFSQGDTSLRREYGGSGLGLAISKRLAEAMGGKIECQSRVDKGSTFVLTLRLPLASHKMHFSGGSNVASPRTPASGHTLRRSRDSAQALPQQGEAIGRSGAQTRQDLGEPIAGDHTESRVAEPAPPAATDTTTTATKSLEGKSEGKDNGKGAEATLKANGAKTRAEPQAKCDESAGLKGKRVLLVEDNQVNQKVGVRMLSSLGCEAIVAVNGLEAVNVMERHYGVTSQEHATDGPDHKIKAFTRGKGDGAAASGQGQTGQGKMATDESEHGEANHIDLILMDCQMPVMDGFKATTRIRKLERQIGELSAASGESRSDQAEAPHIPILALTASATNEYQQKCFQQGMDDFLSKPLNRTTLSKMLCKWLLEDSERDQHESGP